MRNRKTQVFKSTGEFCGRSGSMDDVEIFVRKFFADHHVAIVTTGHRCVFLQPLAVAEREDKNVRMDALKCGCFQKQLQHSIAVIGK